MFLFNQRRLSGDHSLPAHQWGLKMKPGGGLGDASNGRNRMLAGKLFQWIVPITCSALSRMSIRSICRQWQKWI